MFSEVMDSCRVCHITKGHSNSLALNNFIQYDLTLFKFNTQFHFRVETDIEIFLQKAILRGGAQIVLL